MKALTKLLYPIFRACPSPLPAARVAMFWGSLSLSLPVVGSTFGGPLHSAHALRGSLIPNFRLWTLLIICLSFYPLLAQGQPNIIVIVTDDQGYQDVGCYDAPKIKTPHLDQMAKEGIRLTNFYVTASVCSPSRAALLTGRYAYRNQVGGVFFPDVKGMSSTEITIAEMLKQGGYKTSCIGKWHLGDLEGALPQDQGFDEYFGIPYSNDMYIGANQKFSEEVVFREGYNLNKAQADQVFVKDHSRKAIKEKGIRNVVPLFEGKEIIEYPCNQTTLTKRYFERAKQFIETADTDPFFLYLTPAMPHIPLAASGSFKNTSAQGLYGDVIEEIDWNVGQLIQHLKEIGKDENTLIIFTSDNGPWLSFKEYAGSAKPLRAGKFTNYEGGVRVPCIMRWPGTWEPGKTSDLICSTLDFLPTLAHYARIEPPNVALDGMNLALHLENTQATIPRNHFFYSRKKKIDGVRKGDWKYLPNSGARYRDSTNKAELFNLKEDIGETKNVHDQYPKIVAELAQMIQDFDRASYLGFNDSVPVSGQWSKGEINTWYDKQPWLVGCNYYPATAINQIEMWQASTWDPERIDLELSWAAKIGMNTLRVYLHNMVWEADEEGFYQRIDEFLSICQKHKIRPWFVFFDDCHYPNPILGPQPLPVKKYHNSGWLNCPTRDLAYRYAEGNASYDEIHRLKGYVQQTMIRFKDDDRILLWELYNEPGRGNTLKGGELAKKRRPPLRDKSNQLVYDSWVWAREINPSQPITSTTAGSLGEGNIKINRINSDLHSIHAYGPPNGMRGKIQEYQKDDRPIIVSEWLARTSGNTVQDCLPIMKEMNVGAVNWGFVSGKSGTIWPWGSRRDANKEKRSLIQERLDGNIIQPGDPFPEPELWFHDLFRFSGDPFDPEEIEVFQKLTGANKK